MKTYEEMAQNALERIENHEAEQKKRRKTAVKIAAPVLSFCLVAMLGIGVWQSGMLNDKSVIADPAVSEKTASEKFEGSVPEKTDTSAAESVPNSVAEKKTDTTVITKNDDGQKGSTGGGNMYAYFWWEKLSVSGSLYHALEEQPDAVFAVLASYRPTVNEISFVYEGKTLEEWATEAFAEQATPDAKNGYKLAYNAFLESAMPEAVSRLSASGIECERTAYANNCLTLLVTAEQLAHFPLEDRGSWYFDIASSDTLKGASRLQDYMFEVFNFN